MKSFLHVLCFVVAITFVPAVQAKLPEYDQLCTLIDGVVLPMFQSLANESVTNNSTGLSVIIVGDRSLRKKLSEKYIKFARWLKFEPASAVVFEDAKRGQSERYIHKLTGKTACVLSFDMISSEKNKCVVEWDYAYASLGGFSKIIMMTFSDKGWSIVDIKLKSVS